MKNLKIGTGYALNYLTCMQEHGRNSVPIFELAYFSFNPIEDGKEKLPKSAKTPIAESADFAESESVEHPQI